MADRKLIWRAMTPADLAGVCGIAAEVHPQLPEDDSIFAERQRLYPAGCLVLGDEQGLEGYVISHPWRYGQPPKLNSRLGQLPAAPDTYYLHDIALRPAARGQGAAVTALFLLRKRARAEGIGNISLVAVNNSAPYWFERGFQPVNDPALAAQLASYEADAAYMQLLLG